LNQKNYPLKKCSFCGEISEEIDGILSCGGYELIDAPKPDSNNYGCVKPMSENSWKFWQIQYQKHRNYFTADSIGLMYNIISQFNEHEEDVL
jgi:hypothetical protein